MHLHLNDIKSDSRTNEIEVCCHYQNNNFIHYTYIAAYIPYIPNFRNIPTLNYEAKVECSLKIISMQI